MRNKIIYFVFTTGSSKTPHKGAGTWEAMQQQNSRGGCQLSHFFKLLPSCCQGHRWWEIQSPLMRVKRCPGRNQAALCLGCQAMIPNPFKSFLLLLHHQWDACSSCSTLNQSLHTSTLFPPQERQKSLWPLFLFSSLQDVEPTLLRRHRALCWQPCQSHPACYHPSIPLNCIKIMGLGSILDSLYFTQPSSGGKPGWTEVTEAQLSQGLDGAPCPGHTLPFTSVTAWKQRAVSLQEKLHLKCPTHTTQADYNYKLKE